MTNFLRRTWGRYSKLGKKRKKKQVWRKPTGRDNKIRERRKNRPARVEIGYKKNKKEKPRLLLTNIKDLENAGKNLIIILGKVGKKKKIEIAQKASEKKIEIQNLNIEKFLKEIKKEKILKSDQKMKDKKTTLKETKNGEQNESEKEKIVG